MGGSDVMATEEGPGIQCRVCGGPAVLIYDCCDEFFCSQKCHEAFMEGEGKQIHEEEGAIIE